MKIAVYSLTRDRLEYTKACFASLREKTGVDFDHYVVDQGSRDGSADWLHDVYRPKWQASLSENVGISKGSNLALHAIATSGTRYDLICKVDNDCLVLSDNILGQIGECYAPLFPRYVLSPAVVGINRQPSRARFISLAGRRIGITAIVGGLFHCVPADVYLLFRYPETLPPGQFQDEAICRWVKDRGGDVGYVEGLQVEHFRGTDQQAIDHPEYFERKWAEMSQSRLSGSLKVDS